MGLFRGRSAKSLVTPNSEDSLDIFYKQEAIYLPWESNVSCLTSHSLAKRQPTPTLKYSLKLHWKANFKYSLQLHWEANFFLMHVGKHYHATVQILNVPHPATKLERKKSYEISVGIKHQFTSNLLQNLPACRNRS